RGNRYDGGLMATRTHAGTPAPHAPTDVLDMRIDDIGWAAVFIVTGVLWLLPVPVPLAIWLIAIGLVLLGANMVRYLYEVPLRVLSTALGILSFSAGVTQLSGVTLPIVAIMLILVGG